MNWLWKTLTTTVGQKILMAISGLSLCGFLVVHLAGNLLLYADSDGHKFNEYAEAIHKQQDTGLLYVAELGLLGLFAVHIALAVATACRNRHARSSRYAVKVSKKPGGWALFDASSLMVVTGIMVFIFLGLHLADLRFGQVESTGELGRAQEFIKSSPATVEHVRLVLTNPISGPVYLIGAILLAIHVSHGFASAFQSLGFDHPKYAPLIKCISICFAWIVGIGFASFPVWAMLTR